jgi:hypothetical protein
LKLEAARSQVAILDAEEKKKGQLDVIQAASRHFNFYMDDQHWQSKQEN